MDFKDASAMTEASGLADNTGTGKVSTASGNGASRPHEPPGKTATAQVAQQLRDIAMTAPLRSLVAAFIIGVLVARRR
ncbi:MULTISPECIES: hypothetical protein [unclassified Bradyrhizobium]|uniref:hypothetical protein n=1 Tax=unclassified Bradyrhizobium TaxID=2631580 RepID=UPI0020B1FAF1|nr:MULTISPECIES: hypothetical protein [unclassified Bradyrhizobium]MCP3402077.1 hypothetical protein [Bradyrhizobium sp. CCGB20]MCP3410565.1 hypothetical protein [Bradyrhizobium sp. CCGB01]